MQHSGFQCHMRGSTDPTLREAQASTTTTKSHAHPSLTAPHRNCPRRASIASLSFHPPASIPACHRDLTLERSGATPRASDGRPGSLAQFQHCPRPLQSPRTPFPGLSHSLCTPYPRLSIPHALHPPAPPPLPPQLTTEHICGMFQEATPITANWSGRCSDRRICRGRLRAGEVCGGVEKGRRGWRHGGRQQGWRHAAGKGSTRGELGAAHSGHASKRRCAIGRQAGSGYPPGSRAP